MRFYIFYNYNSPKSIAFQSHQQISACFFWSKINTQIRMKANIKKTSIAIIIVDFKPDHLIKNALAITNQSSHIYSYDDVYKSTMMFLLIKIYLFVLHIGVVIDSYTL